MSKLNRPPAARSWLQNLMKTLRLKIGRLPPPEGKSILLCIRGQPSAWARDVIRLFHEVYPREFIFLVGGASPSSATLESGAQIPYPHPLPETTRRYLGRLRTGLILVDQGAKLPRSLSACAIRNDIAIVFADRDPLQTMDMVGPEFAKKRDPRFNLKKRVRIFLWNNLFFRFHAHKLKKLTSLDEINASLDHPESILCLGNGPSSEDVPVVGSAYDSVFRVNHRWADRGMFTSPDVVFTSALDSVLHVGRDILYAFIDDARAMRIVMKARQKMERLRFTNAIDLGFPADIFAPYQPTNGVIMIFLAVKLAPKRLTIAGVDLYRDARGCYPDDTALSNNYTSDHNADLELNLIVQLLDSYKGKLTIYGENLEYEYERYISEKTSKT
jgi:hypothetical protein